ncbi:MAG: hypothetical protein FXF47_08825 [Candidatus Mcinerneyibacterium aminivorans]|uniref:Uncharacterized protein n=1 Tax=Candidatus Mcinerneyibacterium aminivorans TaxID=2703815 RepID=A0A5D0MBW3_9BACT|nr:MAG: hypothetical protein FXF47_08825 [Candidatus Mcinerneyibacterium aminivorans]
MRELKENELRDIDGGAVRVDSDYYDYLVQSNSWELEGSEFQDGACIYYFENADGQVLLVNIMKK